MQLSCSLTLRHHLLFSCKKLSHINIKKKEPLPSINNLSLKAFSIILQKSGYKVIGKIRFDLCSTNSEKEVTEESGGVLCSFWSQEDHQWISLNTTIKSYIPLVRKVQVYSESMFDSGCKTQLQIWNSFLSKALIWVQNGPTQHRKNHFISEIQNHAWLKLMKVTFWLIQEYRSHNFSLSFSVEHKPPMLDAWEN